MRQIVDDANVIIDEYRSQGYDITLRFLYYKFIARDLFPEDRYYYWDGSKWKSDPTHANQNSTKNNMPNYEWLSTIISNGRVGGLIDWDSLTDSLRELEELRHWEDPSDILKEDAKIFRIDIWKDQPYRPEIWIEKDALASIFRRIAQRWDIPLMVCRGYTSQTAMWIASQRLLENSGNGQTPIIFHFGDHDPSGIDMSRDIQDRLELFTGDAIEFERLALNREQITRYNPPPNPAKVLDPRAKGYIAEFGRTSWELDSMEPPVLEALMRTSLNRIIDTTTMAPLIALQNEHKETLVKIGSNYERVQKYLNKTSSGTRKKGKKK